MIHNPQVNKDLKNRGIRFLQDTHGKQLIPFESLSSTDIVITPAFGTSLEIDALLKSRGFIPKIIIQPALLWKKSGIVQVKWLKKNFTVIIHGKPGT